MNTRSFLQRHFVTAVAFVCVALLGIPAAHAATFAITLDKQSFAIGDEFTADIRMDTENVGVNAAQGTISFSPSVLSVSKIDRGSSVFNFWLQDPAFSNTAGTVTFLGGSTSGFTGASLETFKITFKVMGVGSSTITFTDGAITASDGSGTNVMRGTAGVSISAVSKGTITTIAPPTQITRTPTPAQGLPAAPSLTIPVYPDPAKWSNILAPFNVKWTLPSDVTDVATLINKDPRGMPARSEGLFDNKNFAALSDGIWYLHVQFKNANGWGPTTHYALRVDSTPPPAFNVQVTTGASSDDPTPTVTYAIADSLSGISAYYILVDNNVVATTTNATFTLPPQKPGKHVIRVAAHDNAGNITEGSATITIAPIASPTVMLAGGEVYANEGGISLNGSTLVNGKVRLALKDASGTTLEERTASADTLGEWSAAFEEPLKVGAYVIEVTAVDVRGAESFPVSTKTINVRERPLLTIGVIGISKNSLIWILVLLIGGGVGAGVYIGRRSRERQSRRILIAKRDVANAFTTIKKDLIQILDALEDQKLSDEEITRTKHTLERMHENITSMERYIISNITEIKE